MEAGTIQYWIQGMLLGLAYLAPIGMQNLYVINTALRMGTLRTYQVAVITTSFDITLALAAFFGIGLLLEAVPIFVNLMLLAGCLALVYFGGRIMLARPSLDEEINVDEPLPGIVFACFAVTWLNPQALLDGTLLLGGMRASLPGGMETAFIVGVITASCLWFTGLATVTRAFSQALRGRPLRIVNALCGLIIILFGLNLGYQLMARLY